MDAESNRRQLSLSEIKRIELDLLVEFDRMCNANGLYYTLCGGTLLGAIRHHGFIPWDDDIDVLMPRADYDKFLNMSSHAGLPEHIDIVSWKDGTSYYPFIKLLDKRTEIETKYVEDISNKIWIDVFPIDGNPEDSQELNRVYKKSKFYRKILTTKVSKIGGGKSFLKRLIKPLVRLLLTPLSTSMLCKKIDAFAKSYDFEHSEYVGGIVWGYGPCERINKKAYMSPVKVVFEGLTFTAPSNYDEYLSGLYGNYMELPPEEKRLTHEIVAYMINEKNK